MRELRANGCAPISKKARPRHTDDNIKWDFGIAMQLLGETVNFSESQVPHVMDVLYVI